MTFLGKGKVTMKPWDSDIKALFLQVASALSRGGGRGVSKHRNGRQPPKNMRLHRKRRRKAQRQARRYARLCASGRKHKYGRP